MMAHTDYHEPATRYRQRCANCHGWVSLLGGGTGAGWHARTHADADSGAEVRLVWCAGCVAAVASDAPDADPLFVELVENDNAPDGDPVAAARMWALHEQIHRRVIEREARIMETAMGTAVKTTTALAAMIGLGATSIGESMLADEQAKALRAVFFVPKDCRLRAHTFRGAGVAWGVRARCEPAPKPSRR